MKRPSPSWRSIAALGLGAMLLLASGLSAHDFWLVPDAFRLALGGSIEVSGQTSSRFPTSEAAVALDRIAEARVIGAGSDAPIRELSHGGSSLRIRHRPQGAGQYVIAMTLHPRSVRESGEGFVRYLMLEGAAESAERYRREGLLPPRDSVTRRYAKYAKTFVQVGTAGPRAFDRVAGHPLEFVPLRDPSRAIAGERLRFRVLYRGQPLARLPLHAGWANGRDISLRTDAQGEVEVRLTSAGTWNIRAIHIVPAPAGSGADWDTHWATAVWEVRGARVR